MQQVLMVVKARLSRRILLYLLDAVGETVVEAVLEEEVLLIFVVEGHLLVAEVLDGFTFFVY
jgi:hypothetical protein